jgi:hypothetical protein
MEEKGTRTCDAVAACHRRASIADEGINYATTSKLTSWKMVRRKTRLASAEASASASLRSARSMMACISLLQACHNIEVSAY